MITLLPKSRSSFFLITICLGFLAQCQSIKVVHPKIKGVSFVASRDTITQKHIDPVKQINATWVSIMPFGFMEKKNAKNLYYNDPRQWYGERVDGVKQSISMMHNNEIKVMLKPQIWIGNGFFTGFLEMETTENWLHFENQYQKMMLHFAKIAEETNTEILCIGTELNNFVTNRKEFWESFIKEIRKVYSGKITYAENWDKIEEVHFWNTLDFIGVDAYFPISDNKTPSLEEVIDNWLPIQKKLKILSDKNKKPILFTEFGYRSIDFAGEKPWDTSRIDGQVNEDAQNILLLGLLKSNWHEQWFAGGFLWKWFHDANQLSTYQNNRFSIQNKLAQKTLKDFFALNP